ncbi:hypothetical protein ARMGADRAFT_1096213 [Armillaria gallica]|uniref:Uncharacterized protein n=1 Tax=Armillaria gallica TaxID=47427 RepID=A0A2H3ELK3_ARMGA|nr:hypothetical protein ARMGADRAFT_1096213 [Armillaria gallica]
MNVREDCNERRSDDGECKEGTKNLGTYEPKMDQECQILAQRSVDKCGYGSSAWSTMPYDGSVTLRKAGSKNGLNFMSEDQCGSQMPFREVWGEYESRLRNWSADPECHKTEISEETSVGIFGRGFFILITVPKKATNQSPYHAEGVLCKDLDVAREGLGRAVSSHRQDVESEPGICVNLKVPLMLDGEKHASIPLEEDEGRLIFGFYCE